jgi:hypothetical protein
MGSYVSYGGRESVEPLFFESPARARDRSLSLGMPANQATGTAGRRGGGAAGASASQPPRSLSLSAGRPSLRPRPPNQNKQTRPITTTRRTDSSSSKRLPQPSKPTSNLRPENPWSLSMTRNPEVDSRQQQSHCRHCNNLCTSFCEKHRTTLLSFFLAPYLFLCSPSSVLLTARRNNDHRTTIETSAGLRVGEMFRPARRLIVVCVSGQGGRGRRVSIQLEIWRPRPFVKVAVSSQSTTWAHRHR